MDFTAALQFGWKMGEDACVFTGFVLTFLGNSEVFNDYPFLSLNKYLSVCLPDKVQPAASLKSLANSVLSNIFCVKHTSVKTDDEKTSIT